MPFLEWTDAFSIGVAEIDQQHQRLLELLNRLHDASERSNSLATLASVLNEFEVVKRGIGELAAYASYHFETEEQYMVQHAYPETEQHRREHRAFAEKTRLFQQAAAGRKKRLCPEIAAFCREWWQTHVQGTDRRLGVFLVEKGLR
jgi:hemerythrin